MKTNQKKAVENYQDISSTTEQILIVGYGTFGRRAVEMLIGNDHPPFLITVVDQKQPDDMIDGINFVQEDGIKWFVNNFHKNGPINRIIPALPIHLAAHWVMERLITECKSVNEMPVPPGILQLLPHPYRSSESTYAVSHANFICPPDCPEPEEYCTFTGKPRKKPLFEILERLPSRDISICVIRSSQFAPGLGGFYAKDLWRLYNEIVNCRTTNILVGTACKCHGIITTFQMSSLSSKSIDFAAGV